MNQNKFYGVISVGIILFTLNACSAPIGKMAGSFIWTTNGEGWVVQKNKNNCERFFAIGTWHVPGYTFSNLPESDSAHIQNKVLFEKKTSPFNMVFIVPGYEKDYMSQKIHVMNPFSPILHNYLDRIASLPKGNDKDYYRSQYIKREIDDPAFIHYLDSQMVMLLEQKTNDAYIFSHIDEIALGGVGYWSVPPSVGALINQRLKKYDPGALVFVDLLGHARGSTYFFEKKYLETHPSLPDDPPYHLLSEEARKCKIPLLPFYEAYNGLPLYEFKDGNYSYMEYDWDTLVDIWTENTKRIAKDYRGNGDVFGINAFRDFYAYPILSGITVDALREGLGKGVPIWLYFDGNGYAKPGNVSPAEYIHSVKCQIYTAIIHGATGVLFWNDWSKTPEVFDLLLPMMEELKKNLELIKSDTVEKMIDGNKHAVIKKNRAGKKYIIATNTDKKNSQTLFLPGGEKMILAPLETYVAALP